MFELFQNKKSKKFHWNLKARNGQVILTSQGYSSKKGAENGIESVRKNCKDEKCFDMLTAKDGRTYFNLKSGNGQVIGKSQMYKSTSGCRNGIKSVSTNAPTATINDMTA
ncbi:MAG: YegP family protein [Saprospiraceae bacterium]|nr:YegP family protein [Saprospiraceae bacterium]